MKFFNDFDIFLPWMNLLLILLHCHHMCPTCSIVSHHDRPEYASHCAISLQ